MDRLLCKTDRDTYVVGTRWKTDALGNRYAEETVDVSADIRQILADDRQARYVYAVGATPEDAVRAYAKSEYWGDVSGFDSLECDIPYTWGRRFRADGTSFKAAGHEVPGGFVLTWWK